MNRCSTSVLELLKSQRVMVILAAGLLAASCGTKSGGTTEDTAEPAADVESADGLDDAIDDTGTPDAESDAGTTDTGPDVKVDTQDVPDIAIDVPHECDTDQQCYDIKKANAGCQITTCVANVCTEPVKKTDVNVCCDDTDCPKVAGQTEACNTTSNQCEYKTQAGWCPDKQLILQPVTFEQAGNLQGFTGKVSTTGLGSTVAWQVSSKRSHSGKSSLYLGNECYNYDTSASAATSCQSTGNAAKLTATLESPELVIPKDAAGQLKPAYLHYWLWLDAEPPFLQSNAGLAGTSCTSCGIDQVCVNLGNGSKDACLTEKDTLKVFINGSSVTPTAVWASTKIGKTTGGKWVHRVINLAGFGATATVTWQFGTGDASANGYEGVYIDDVSVETQCDKEGVTCDKATACTNTSGNACAIDSCTFYDNVTDKGICFGDLTPGCCAGVTDCQDNNTCTVDTCVQANGAPTGLCSNVPDAKNPQCCLAENLFNDAFENGIAAWKNIGSNSTAVSWRVNPTGGTGGTKALTFGDGTYGSYADPKLSAQGPKGTICSPEVQLKSGTLYDVAKFNLNLETEWCGQPTYSNPPGSLKSCTTDSQCTTAGETCNTVLGVCALNAPLDKLTVTFNTNGQFCGATECSNIVANIKTPLWSSDAISGCTTGQSIQVEVPLSAYAGKKGRVCFTFDAGDASGNAFFGPRIDDFKLDVTCEETECTNDMKCAAKCEPVVESGTCNLVTNKCECKATGVCTKDSQCPVEDNCTIGTCVQGKCDYVQTPGCCAEKNQINGESFEGSKGTQLPTGWTTAFATDPVSITGEPYDQTMKWHISADNFYGQSPDQYALYFGNTFGNYDAGSQKVPYGLVKTAPVSIPANGTTILTFHVNLSTEWDAPAVFQSFAFAIDRLRVGFVDATKSADVTWAWSSYEIGGTTNGQWATVSVKVPAGLAGKSAALVWEFDAGSTKNNNHIGPYIDGINLWTTCTPPVCVTGADCTPPTPDACKSYNCKFEETGKSFSCDTPFKPGPGCCQPTTPLPAVTFENASFSASNIAVAATPGILANWNVIPHKYLNGKYEAYFGNPAKWNYADPVANCGGVSSTLDSPVLKIGTNVKQSAQLQFSIYADIEPPSGSFQTEHFKVFIKYGGTTEKLWDATDPTYGLKPSQFKTKQNITLPLTKFQGLNVVIEFVFDSGDCSLNDKYEGVFLDDLQVTEPCTP